MCGIAGIVAAAGGRVDEHALRAVTAALAPRGPDGEGLHLDAGAGLGHRRLAIIDLAGGRQPLYSEDRSVVAVVNGEIYNFVALRRELEAKGHRFATRTDSEVLVHGYEQWGERVLDRLEGMFALAVWEPAARSLLLARDRLGEKPLYWARLADGSLAFASELKALRLCAGFDDAVDVAALARYLVYEYLPAPLCIARGARKLEPGFRLRYTPGTEPAIARYWDLPLPPSGALSGRRCRDARRAVAELRAELARSVRERLVADVPLGVFLSGGIDSSTVAALAAQARGGDLDTFAIGFDDPTFDESHAARAVAQHLGSRHHERRVVAADMLTLLPRIGDLLDEPLGDSSIVPTHLLSRFARDRVAVALGGDGGDELFFGYPTFVAEQLARWSLDAAPAPLPRLLESVGRGLARRLPVSLRYFSPDFKLRQFMRGIGLRGARRHQAWLASLLPAEALATLAPEAATAVGADLYDTVDHRLAACRSRDGWDRLLYFYAKGYLADGVLTKVDRASMAVGLEVRAPFLDSRVVALACSVDPALRLRGLQTKYLLKRAVRDLLPASTVHRRKQGFAMPIGRWLRGELRPLLDERLEPGLLRRQGFFSAAQVRRLVDEHCAGAADHRKPLWTLLAFQSWWLSWRGA
ncbi:MAG: asparagine synthase (glutamine-hydrolyzing) [Deltaproteobacteria bacterium]|nr:asparagine synthase (glutamine-hydrolyzing) [Deltaproteobacteria bacterium]